MPSANAEFIPAGVREWLAAPLLRLVVQIVLKPVLSPNVPIAWQRWWLRQFARAACQKRKVDIQPGIVGGVAGEWASPRSPANANTRATILYLHGGAYCIGSPATHRALTSRLAQATGLSVFAVDYRLAPEHPMPAAVEDAVSVYISLIERGPVFVAGDSAGGGLALATALAVQQRGVSAPAALVLFSPWVDLTTCAISDKAPKGEAMLSVSWLRTCARHYLAGQDAAAPLASPIYGDLRGLPATLVQTGTDDLLHGEAVRVHGELQTAGIAVRCEIVPARWHVFQLHAGLLPSANAAVDRAAAFIAANIGS
jgi:acetyl esterase/lipase